MSTVTKEQRDKMPAEHFAVPGKHELLIHDEKHTRLAWDMVDRTHGLTPEEKREARRRILHRAKELGIDTADWNKSVHAGDESTVHFIEAMALNIPTEPHVNKLPFSGVLTRVGVASDLAPEGTGGKRTLITKEAAEAALGTLLGMAVDYVDGLDGHDAQAKIGIITAADVVGSELKIQGFFYAMDFPDLVNRIRAKKAKLGFSYEAQMIQVVDKKADPWVIEELMFTGAAVLRKDKAAYSTTSIAAASDTTEGLEDMDPKELEKQIKDAVAAAVAPLQKIITDQAAVAASTHAIVERVRPHAERLEDAADKMEAEGIGCHATRGHAHVLRKMAGHMMAEAHLGRTPDIYNDTGWLRADATGASASADNEAIKKLTDSVASLTTKVSDLSAKVTASAAAGGDGTVAPKRKTAVAKVSAAISKYGLEEDEDGLIDHVELSDAMKKANVQPAQRMSVINEFRLAGKLREPATA